MINRWSFPSSLTNEVSVVEASVSHVTRGCPVHHEGSGVPDPGPRAAPWSRGPRPSLSPAQPRPRAERRTVASTCCW